MEWTQTLTLPDTADAAERWPQSVTEFEALVDALRDELVHFAFCRLRQLPDAEDVVQDVLVQAYAERAKHQAVAHVRPYLYRMVSNRCADLLRKRRRSGPSLDETGTDDLATATSQEPSLADAAHRLRQIEGLLSRLPSRQAEALRLRIFAGLSFRVIAEAVGTSVPTIKSRFRYGVERLRGILIQEETQS
jgi:RNA polymerase sigma-70 factor, ECF subfamily